MSGRDLQDLLPSGSGACCGRAASAAHSVLHIAAREQICGVAMRQSGSAGIAVRRWEATLLTELRAPQLLRAEAGRGPFADRADDDIERDRR